MAKLKVLVIEPDMHVRLVIVEMLQAATDIEVVGVASDVMLARMQVKARKPDVLLLSVVKQLDIAASFLASLMQSNTIPLLLLSRHQAAEGGQHWKQIRSHAVTTLIKPCDGVSISNRIFSTTLLNKVRTSASHFNNKTEYRQQAISTASSSAIDKTISRFTAPPADKIVALGASTGGTEALRHVIAKFPSNFPPVLIVQHLPAAFADSFIKRLDKSTAMQTVAATDGVKIKQGYIYVGAGGEQFRIEKQGADFICRVGGKEKVNGFCPSVDALFDSLALHAGVKAVGALMTGMGDDGAKGLKKMRQTGSRTVAQDRESSVVWGMPRAAVEIGAAEMQLHLNKLGDKLVELVR